MKYLIKGTDITGADYGRVLLNGLNIFLKDFLHYKKINLGLPSGTLWADRNIGASNIYDYGKLFQWGDTTPYDVPQHTGNLVNDGQKKFSRDDYKWDDGTTLTKYNKTDGKVVLDLEDDAAYVNMGSDWRMPTKEQVTELFKETTQELYAKLTDGSDPVKVANGTYNTGNNTVSWTYIDGHSSSEVNGKLSYMKLLSKTNGNFLVVPSSVRVYGGSVAVVGLSSEFWSSSVNSDHQPSAWFGCFSHSNYGVSSNLRCDGAGVRGVVGQ